MKYLDNPTVAALVASAPAYQKTALTQLRLPTPAEHGSPLETWVKEGDGVRRESTNTIAPDSIIARNPGALFRDGAPVYNEWIIARDIAIKHYGQEVVDGLGATFSEHRKQNLTRMLLIDEQVMDALGVYGDRMAITVGWSDEPMIAQRGDYLTCGGYSVSAHDKESTYTLAGNPNPEQSNVLAFRKSR